MFIFNYSKGFFWKLIFHPFLKVQSWWVKFLFSNPDFLGGSYLTHFSHLNNSISTWAKKISSGIIDCYINLSSYKKNLELASEIEKVILTQMDFSVFKHKIEQMTQLWLVLLQWPFIDELQLHTHNYFSSLHLKLYLKKIQKNFFFVVFGFFEIRILYRSYLTFHSRDLELIILITWFLEKR